MRHRKFYGGLLTKPPRSRPELAALPRRRPQPPALPDPPRTRFLRSRTPALASPRDKAGQFCPLLGRGDSRGDVNTARPAALSPSPPPHPAGVRNLFPQSCPAPRAPLGQASSAPFPFSKSRFPTVARGHLAPFPSSQPLSPPQPPENPRQTPEQTTQARGGGAEGGGGTRDSEALSPRPPRSLPPASAARALTCSPRRLGRPQRCFPSRQGRGLAPPAPLAGRPEGAGASPAARAAPLGEEETKQRRAAPRSAPRPRRPTDPQPPKRRRRHRARRGEQWWPPPSPRSRPPPSTPHLSSSPSASSRRHQDTRVRLPHPARSERSSPPHAARGGRHRQSPQRLSNPGRLFIPRGASPPPAPTGPPTCLSGSLDSCPPLIPQLLPNPPSQVKTLATCPAPCSGLPHPTLGSNPKLVQGPQGAGRRVGVAGPRVHLQRPPAPFSQLARTARTHPRHSAKPPAGPGCHSIPSSGLPPFSRDSSALGRPGRSSLHSTAVKGGGAGGPERAPGPAPAPPRSVTLVAHRPSSLAPSAPPAPPPRSQTPGLVHPRPRPIPRNYHPPNGRAARRLVPAFADGRVAGLSAQLRSAAGGPLALPPELRAPAPSHCHSSLG
ncbi:basic salivary proline-rich protein 2-like [Lutra lutra]|uniref:basic salivary proline-rich protein 2-like n=1 Tax=Lutra lutra TaxID=9657 RepID=UPI001FD04536|nr:basic salivary proline-rich protein 2-like [Lutra lutra]